MRQKNGYKVLVGRNKAGSLWPLLYDLEIISVKNCRPDMVEADGDGRGGGR